MYSLYICILFMVCHLVLSTLSSLLCALPFVYTLFICLLSLLCSLSSRFPFPTTELPVIKYTSISKVSIASRLGIHTAFFCVRACVQSCLIRMFRVSLPTSGTIPCCSSFVSCLLPCGTRIRKSIAVSGDPPGEWFT